MKHKSESRKTLSSENSKASITSVEDKNLFANFACKTRFLRWIEFSFNPVVTFVAFIIIIAFVSWSIIYEEVAAHEFGSWKSWIGKKFTWLYIGTKDAWLLFLIYLYFSKYGGIKLGKDDAVPDYSSGTWFSMLFSCGVGTGLFFFGVGEPILHYTSENRYSSDPYLVDNTLAQQAINLTVYHWGLHAWTVYCVVGLLLALVSYRQGLPLTIKSCFYPLIGDKIFGWPGDVVDILSIIATLFGVCTSLGLGTIQLNDGLNVLTSLIPVGVKTQVLIIWIITGVASLSVMSGLNYGVRRLSEICFGSGVFLMLSVLLLDNTVFILNLLVQSAGYYLHWLIKLGFHSDAFEQLGSNGGLEDRGRVLPSGVETTDGPQDWMDWWTLFYWGWWVAWSPFVGMFIAKISKGRTVKEFIIGVLAAPTIYTFFWLVIFGGAGLRMERDAGSNSLCCHNLNVSKLVNFGSTIRNIDSASVAEFCTEEGCNDCSITTLSRLVASHPVNWTQELASQVDVLGEENWGVTTESRNFTRLSCRVVQEMWFDMMMSYGGLGKFLSGFSLISLVLYFVTSSDSGSLVIDSLASNGHPDPPRLQRLIWAVLEGLTSTALLVAGGKESLSALQAVSIATGSVYTVLLCLMCVSLYKTLAAQVDNDEESKTQGQFKIHILDPFLSDPIKDLIGKNGRELLKDRLRLFAKFLANIVMAPYSVAKSMECISGNFYYPLISLGATLILSVAFQILQIVVPELWSMGWIMYILHAAILTTFRLEIRTNLRIPGNVIVDFMLSLFLYPGVALQISETVLNTVHFSQDQGHKGEINGVYDKGEIIGVYDLTTLQSIKISTHTSSKNKD